MEANLSDTDLDEAENRVREHVKTNFWPYLNLDWQPWKDALSARFFNEYRQAEESAIQLSSDQEQFNRHIDHYILQHELPAEDPEVRAQVGTEVLRSIRLQFLAPLSYRFYPELEQMWKQENRVSTATDARPSTSKS